MSKRRELVEAELALLDAEEAFVAAKTVNTGTSCKTCGRPNPTDRTAPALLEAKQVLRDARVRYRTLRAEMGGAGAAVSPATVKASGKVKSL